MTKPSGVGTDVGNPHTGMSRSTSPRCSVALPLLSKTCPARSPPRCQPAPSAQTTSVSPLVPTAMAECLRDLPATGWHNHLAASFVRNLKSRGQCDLRSQSSPPRGLAASSDGGEVEVVWRARSALRCNAKHRRVWKKTANSGKKRPTLEIRTVCGYPSGMSRPRFSRRFATRSARSGGSPPLGNRRGFHGLSKRVQLHGVGGGG